MHFSMQIMSDSPHHDQFLTIIGAWLLDHNFKNGLFFLHILQDSFFHKTSEREPTVTQMTQPWHILSIECTALHIAHLLALREELPGNRHQKGATRSSGCVMWSGGLRKKLMGRRSWWLVGQKAIATEFRLRLQSGPSSTHWIMSEFFLYFSIENNRKLWRV
jgi:hypothetical protein